MTKAKLFMSSQAVRLPAEFRFEGSDIRSNRFLAELPFWLRITSSSWEKNLHRRG
jgi:hypothetical protein